jgi:hypothetical protein
VAAKAPPLHPPRRLPWKCILGRHAWVPDFRFSFQRAVCERCGRGKA